MIDVKAGPGNFLVIVGQGLEIDQHGVLSLSDLGLGLGNLCLEVVLFGIVGQTIVDVVAL